MDEKAILEFVNSHAFNVQLVEESISRAYDLLANGDNDEEKFYLEIEELKEKLEDLAARGCNFRRKDFNILMNKVLLQVEKSKDELILKRDELKVFILDYLKFQREFIQSFREKVTMYSSNQISKSELESFVKETKSLCEKREEEAYQLIVTYKQCLSSYMSKLERLSNRLRRLIDRGESIKAEDIRQLEAEEEREARIAERRSRQEDVRRMLSNFRRQRKDGL